jgi:carbamoylphosphate synthase large subunit
VKPTVLIATTAQWYPTARLAMALAKAGFVVKAVCPSRHPMFKTKAVQESYDYYGLLPLTSFANAIDKAKPDLIVPGDDLATQHLHQLHERESRKGSSKSSLCSLIERSLGSAENFPIVYSRIAFIDIARAEGVRVPETAALKNVAELGEWIERFELPAVLKADGTNGGEGVRIVRTAKDAELAFHELQAAPLLARAVKRTLVDQDAALLRAAILRTKFTMSVQKFVTGTEATSAVACWNGEVIASLHFEVVNKKHAAGHSTVVRLIDNAEMMTAGAKLARRLNLSGLYGFDFMLEAGTRNAYIIEINPRATQVGHLALGAGRDIPAALFSAVSGQAVQISTRATEKDTIALFPQEWLRDSSSPYLRSAFHDVPWEEPELIRAGIRSKKKQNSRPAHKSSLESLSAVGVPRL